MFAAPRCPGWTCAAPCGLCTKEARLAAQHAWPAQQAQHELRTDNDTEITFFPHNRQELTQPVAWVASGAQLGLSSGRRVGGAARRSSCGYLSYPKRLQLQGTCQPRPFLALFPPPFFLDRPTCARSLASTFKCKLSNKAQHMPRASYVKFP